MYTPFATPWCIGKRCVYTPTPFEKEGGRYVFTLINYFRGEFLEHS